MQTDCQLKEFCLDHHHHGDRDQSLISDHHEKVSEIKEEIGHLVENMDPAKDRGIFSTTGHQQVGHCHHHQHPKHPFQASDLYFLESGDKIRYFFEADAFDQVFLNDDYDTERLAIYSDLKCVLDMLQRLLLMMVLLSMMMMVLVVMMMLTVDHRKVNYN